MIYLQLFIGSFLVSAGIGYALWISVRVRLLRERIFEIRDELFDQAVELSALEDIAYIETRETLNRFIRVADHFCWPVLFVSLARSNSRIEMPVSKSAEVQTVLDKAINQTACEFFNYLVRDSLTGRTLALLSRIFVPTANFTNWTTKQLRNLANTRPPTAGGMSGISFR